MTVLNHEEHTTTIFVIGLPDDLHDREWRNLFFFAPGFEQARIVLFRTIERVFQKECWPTSFSLMQPWDRVGIVNFKTFQEAQAALEAIKTLILDGKKCVSAAFSQKNISLHELESLQPVPFSPLDFDETIYVKRTMSWHAHTLDHSLWQNTKEINVNLQKSINPHPNTASPVSLEDSPINFSIPLSVDNQSEAAESNSGFLSSIGIEHFIVPVENPPCNTLYVGNLPPGSVENELRDIFASCHGYKRLSFRVKENGPMCFVEFQDVLCSTAAMHQLQGTMLKFSKKGGIRLSYSKNPLGVRSSPVRK